MKIQKRIQTFILSLFLPCLSFANCLLEIFGDEPLIKSFKSLKNKIKNYCSEEEQAGFEQFIFEVKRLNPVAARDTVEFLEKRMFESIHQNYHNCSSENKEEVDLGECLIQFMLSDIGREFPKGFDPIVKENANNSHKAIGKLINANGNCSFTAVSPNVGLTAFHCFYPKLHPRSNFYGQSMHDLLQKKSQFSIRMFGKKEIKGKAVDFLVFQSLTRFNVIDDDMVLFRLDQDKVFDHYLPIKNAHDQGNQGKFFMAGVPGRWNFDGFNLFERKTDEIEITERLIKTEIPYEKGDSGASLRVRIDDQDYLLGVLFGTSINKTVFSVISSERKELIDKFISETITDIDRSFQFHKLSR